MAKLKLKYFYDAAMGILVEIVYALVIMSACLIMGALILWWLK